MTNILIIQGHPDPMKTHLCHGIANAYRDAAVVAGHSVEMIVVAEHSVPFLRSKSEWESPQQPDFAITGQAAIEKADHIVLIYPLWMGAMPAMLKAWIEQIFRRAFVFRDDIENWQPSLRGKSARVMITTGKPGTEANPQEVDSTAQNILKFCGIDPVGWSSFGHVNDPTGKAQDAALGEARDLGTKAD